MAQKKTSGILHVKRTTSSKLCLTHCTVEKAVDLAAMDKNGKSDPYAVVTSTFNKQRFKSKVCKKTLNPVWNETFDLYDFSLILTFTQHNNVHTRSSTWVRRGFLH